MEAITNKQAYFNYQILETLEAGLKLSGPEVKSVKAGQVKLQGAYVTIQNEEAYLVGAHIAAYKPAVVSQRNYDPDARRKLLLHKKEIRSLIGREQERGISIVPLKVYTSHGYVKLSIGIGRGKKKYDKRETIKKREFERRKRKEED
jgi:SsrA-binding protein